MTCSERNAFAGQHALRRLHRHCVVSRSQLYTCFGSIALHCSQAHGCLSVPLQLCHISPFLAPAVLCNDAHSNTTLAVHMPSIAGREAAE